MNRYQMVMMITAKLMDILSDNKVTVREALSVFRGIIDRIEEFCEREGKLDKALIKL